MPALEALFRRSNLALRLARGVATAGKPIVCKAEREVLLDGRLRACCQEQQLKARIISVWCCNCTDLVTRLAELDDMSLLTQLVCRLRLPGV